MVARADLQRLVAWLTSHDQQRHVSDGPDREVSTQVQAAMMTFLPGPWLIYQGEEWGLPQPELKKDEVTDPLDLLYWPKGPGREGARVLVPWTDDAPGYGFIEGKLWLPMLWDGALESRGRLVARYAELIGLRRELGWDFAEVVSCDADGPVLTMVIATGNLRFEGRFRMGGVAQTPPERADHPVVSIHGGTRQWLALIRAIN